MIAYSGSDATADSSIFIYSDRDSTATANQREWVYCQKEDSVQDIQQDDWEDWREYLKSLWLVALRKRQCLNLPRDADNRLYCRRLGVSISGWLARAGYRKKKN